MRVFEKINPLARLRRWRRGKIDREFKTVKLGLCPRCRARVVRNVRNSLLVYECPKCCRGWVFALSDQSAERKPADPHPPNAEAEGAAHEPGEPEAMYA